MRLKAELPAVSDSVGGRCIVLPVSKSVISEEGCLFFFFFLYCLPERRFRKQNFSPGIQNLKEWALGHMQEFQHCGGGVKSPKENLIFSLRSLPHKNNFP